jgi:hypothetical protein
MKKGFKVSVEHSKKIKVVNKIFEPKEISKYLNCTICTVNLWLQGRRTPTQRYHKGIDLLYKQALDIIDRAPLTTDIKTKSGEIVTLPNILKL